MSEAMEKLRKMWDKESEKKTLVSCIKNLMETQGCSLDSAMNALKIKDEDRASIAEKVKSELVDQLPVLYREEYCEEWRKGYRKGYLEGVQKKRERYIRDLIKEGISREKAETSASRVFIEPTEKEIEDMANRCLRKKHPELFIGPW